LRDRAGCALFTGAAGIFQPSISITKELPVRALLLLPFIGLLYLPFYNHEMPALFGFPFFYWYQLAWVPITSLLIWIVYRHGVRKGVE
jgi:hypothetical protein